MRSRLFLKVYVTLLATLAVVAVASFMFVRMGQDEQDRGWASRRDAFPCRHAASRCGSGSSVEACSSVLQRPSTATSPVFGPRRQPDRSAGRPLPPELLERRPRSRPGGDPHGFVTRLPDGRYVAAGSSVPFGRPAAIRSRYLALVAAVTGLAAYPVVRHLTRRLEQLRARRRCLGRGALDRRVCRDDGKDEVAAVAPELQPGGRSHRAAGRGTPRRCSPMPATNCARRWRGCAWRSISTSSRPDENRKRRDRAQSRRARRSGRGDPAGQPSRPWRASSMRRRPSTCWR